MAEANDDRTRTRTLWTQFCVTGPKTKQKKVGVRVLPTASALVRAQKAPPRPWTHVAIAATPPEMGSPRIGRKWVVAWPYASMETVWRAFDV